MNPTLTVVLPVHNAEAALEKNVQNVMELACDLTSEFGVLVVDDGSTDDTFDVAREMAARFPQVKVMRNPSRRGLGPTLKRLHARLRSDVVIVHDGTSKVDVEEIRAMWINQTQRIDTPETSISDLQLASQTHRAMSTAHQRLAGFQMLSSLMDENEGAEPIMLPEARQAERRPDVGQIPPLPKSNLYWTISTFATSE